VSLIEAATELASDEHLSHRMDAAYRNLDRAVASVVQADNKALIALTFQGAIVAGLALITGSIRDTLRGNNSLAIRIPLVIILISFFACFGLATLRLFHAISPRIQNDDDAEHPSLLFFWGGIAAMPPEEFASKMRKLQPKEIHEGLVRMTHNTAKIALQKFANLRVGFTCLGLQMVFYVGIVLLSVLPS
jgi:Family of unknown function (DUF5706)